MSPNRHPAVVREICALAIAITSAIILAKPVVAAIDATVSPTDGRAGDDITFATGHSGSPQADSSLEGKTGSLYLISTSDFERQVARFGYQVCGSQGAHPLGSLSWKAGVGTLTFRIPEVSGGRYYFQIEVGNARPSCWRVGGAGGSLILTVIGPAEPAGPGPDESGSLVLLVTLVSLLSAVVGTTVVAWLTRQQE